MSRVKGFYSKGGTRRPVTLKKGFDKFEFKVGDEISRDRIPVGQANPKRWNLQKLIALEMTPRTFPKDIDEQILNKRK